MAEFKYKKPEYKFNESIVRPSALYRVGIGVSSATAMTCILNLYKFKNKDFTMRNYRSTIKGHFLLFTGYFVLNELCYSTLKSFHLYTNFWINSSISGFICYKRYSKYLISLSIMPWYTAVLLSQKTCLFLVCSHLIVESYLDLYKALLTYEYEDFIDIHYRLKNQGLSNIELKSLVSTATQKNDILILNTKEKREALKCYTEKYGVKVNLVKFLEFFDDRKEASIKRNE